ncbi:MAG: tRNA pseudouridine(38-40) synthase TruA [Crocinitomix sp.]|nr:tRNA pseudouridine(38-40) synthase TruA [Crocinitomix sp.]
MKTYYYLIHIQYLGFRFHGWQKQPNLKTIHLMVDKTLLFALGHDRFKTMGSSRTDSKVSANHGAFELFLEKPIAMDEFLQTFNSNLPNDIRAIKIEEVDEKFNIIQTPKLKTYLYLFTFGEKPHPFSAAMMTYFKGNLDLELMKQGATQFEGQHNFVKYCTKPSPNTNFNREVTICRITENTTYTANFFPETSYALEIQSMGFMRYQVRLIMGQLIRLGRHEIDLETISESLTGNDHTALDQIAPGSGLILQNLEFDF